LHRIAFQRFRQAEVENLHIPVSGNLHIRRLEITMHDTPLVRGFKGFANALRNFQCVLNRDRSTSDAAGERFALNQLEYEIGITVGFLQVVDAGNIR